jgi:U4/U6 small nuclear ribonucleoprotein PRP3
METTENMSGRPLAASQPSEDTKKRKREDMEIISGTESGAVPDAVELPSAKRPKTDAASPDQASSNAVEDSGKQSKVAALLAKRRAIQEQKAALEKQMGEVDRQQREKGELEKKEIELREKALQSRQVAQAASISGPPERGSFNANSSAALTRVLGPDAQHQAATASSNSSIFDLESIPKYQSTLKANLRFQQEATEKREKLVKKPTPIEQNLLARPARPHPSERKRRPLVFVEPGTYIRKAEDHRNFVEAQQKWKQRDHADGTSAGAVTASAPGPDPPAERKKPKLIEDASIDVEWWDLIYLEDGDYEKVNESKITNLIDHPVLLEPPSEKPSTGPLPLKLTPAEEKRLRKKIRAERLKGQQDRIMLGLEPAQKPRVRLANMMRVMGAEAIQDPTAAEKLVRAETAARETRHHERNQSRKLTPEERKEKLLKKFQEDTSLKTSVTLFRVEDISSGKHRFKVEMNAQQLHLTGTILSGPKFSVIIAEGGPKGIKKFKKLMDRRIKWDEKDDGSEFIIPGPENQKNKCTCIWNGEVLKSAFRDFRMHTSENDAAAKKFLAERGIGHYWDMAVVFDDKEAVS